MGKIDLLKKHKMIMMRGLGYSQQEIADRLKVRQSAVQYQLQKIKKEANERGEAQVFFEYAVIPGIARGVFNFLKKL